MSRPVVYDLPMPPSVNGLYAGKKRRYKSAAYEAWLQAAGYELLAQGRNYIAGKVEVMYELGRPTSKLRQDVGNREKAASDFLVKMGVIEDDSFIERLSIGWSDEVQAGRVRITVKAWYPFPEMD